MAENVAPSDADQIEDSFVVKPRARSKIRRNPPRPFVQMGEVMPIRDRLIAEGEAKMRENLQKQGYRVPPANTRIFFDQEWRQKLTVSFIENEKAGDGQAKAGATAQAAVTEPEGAAVGGGRRTTMSSNTSSAGWNDSRADAIKALKNEHAETSPNTLARMERKRRALEQQVEWERRNGMATIADWQKQRQSQLPQTVVSRRSTTLSASDLKSADNSAVSDEEQDDEEGTTEQHTSDGVFEGDDDEDAATNKTIDMEADPDEEQDEIEPKECAKLTTPMVGGKFVRPVSPIEKDTHNRMQIETPSTVSSSATESSSDQSDARPPFQLTSQPDCATSTPRCEDERKQMDTPRPNDRTSSPAIEVVRLRTAFAPPPLPRHAEVEPMNVARPVPHMAADLETVGQKMQTSPMTTRRRANLSRMGTPGVLSRTIVLDQAPPVSGFVERRLRHRPSVMHDQNDSPTSTMLKRNSSAIPRQPVLFNESGTSEEIEDELESRSEPQSTSQRHDQRDALPDNSLRSLTEGADSGEVTSSLQPDDATAGGTVLAGTPSKLDTAVKSTRAHEDSPLVLSRTRQTNTTAVLSDDSGDEEEMTSVSQRSLRDGDDSTADREELSGVALASHLATTTENSRLLSHTQRTNAAEILSDDSGDEGAIASTSHQTSHNADDGDVSDDDAVCDIVEHGNSDENYDEDMPSALSSQNNSMDDAEDSTIVAGQLSVVSLPRLDKTATETKKGRRGTIDTTIFENGRPADFRRLSSLVAPRPMPLRQSLESVDSQPGCSYSNSEVGTPQPVHYNCHIEAETDSPKFYVPKPPVERPIVDHSLNLRRSSRVRLPKLLSHLGQRAQYKRNSNGDFEIVGVADVPVKEADMQKYGTTDGAKILQMKAKEKKVGAPKNLGLYRSRRLVEKKEKAAKKKQQKEQLTAQWKEMQNLSQDSDFSSSDDNE